MRSPFPLALALAAATLAPTAAAAAPDISGVWSTATATPFQRPAAFAGPTIPAAQAAAFERHANDPAWLAAQASKDPGSRGEAEVGGFTTEWLEPMRLDVIDGAARSSVVVEPADGRVPLRPEARARVAPSGFANKNFDDPEGRPPNERCIFGAIAGPPLASYAYNSLVEIVQTPHAVAVVAEMIHDVRLIELDPHLPPSPPGARDMGDSVGHWEGETLVVETTNFPAEGRGRTLLSPTAKVEERFTRAGPNALRYAFRVDDPVNYSRPWRGERMLRAADSPLREYACHEGNYALPGVLAGARRAEAQAAGGAAR